MTERELLNRLDVWFEYDTDEFVITDDDNFGRGSTQLEAMQDYIRRGIEENHRLE